VTNLRISNRAVYSRAMDISGPIVIQVQDRHKGG
jgi:hypothetical protein